ncbi:MFS transporter [Pseudomonas nitroreducens]|uniref:MFS transporter n=1 Tax=Pseudomonas nitroreducens TaxID=46680 RepID=UPI00147500EC|nr:MFS transporter [Pseudomonas nitroreducens]MDG9853200.1 MFS transporter [Pseudomonas nitroreducens]MDH1073030.1 MFS transporter [Pseudomonas nitroreducens]NMZ75198.1 MFS transporter [Pseudomonas nitroreducens]
MDLRLLLLSLCTFAAGLAEAILTGILPSLADDLNVSLSLAGQLTSLFSLSFAIAAPLLGWLTRGADCRRLLFITLLVFAAFNAGAALSPDYASLLLMRIGMAACCGLLIMQASLLAVELAPPGQRGRAIGLIFMGISGSLVFGVPAGVLVNDWFGWRWIFAAIALYSLPLAALLLALPRRTLESPANGAAYRRQLRSPALNLAQLVSILLLGGHFTLFAYITPWFQQVAGITDSQSIALTLLLIGLAAIGGGYLGGWLSDRLGQRRALIVVPVLFALAMTAIPLSLGHPWLLLGALMVWSTISWMISPAVQSYLLASDPASGSAGVALNTSAMHLGVALGAALGGAAISLAGIVWTPWVGVSLVSASVLCAALSCWLGREPHALGLSAPSR